MADEYSFVEVLNQFERMCNRYNGHNKCIGCPLAGTNISQCRKIAFDQTERFVRIVMVWAAEHPVIYPTWDEWLATQGVRSYDDLDNHIPADIAEKLGIEPKEG